MADATGRVGIVIDGTDKSSPAFKSAGKSLDKFKSGIKALPEQAGKASAALLLLQTSTSQMGGKMADAVNKIGAVVALIATGGPLGLAIGAITALVAGFTYVLDGINAPAEAAKKATRELAKAVNAYAEETRAAQDATEGMVDSLLAIGRSQASAKLIELKFQLIDVTEAAQELAASDTTSPEVLAAANRRIETILDQIQAVKDLQAATEAENRAEDARADARKKRDDEKKLAIDAEKAQTDAQIAYELEQWQKAYEAQVQAEADALQRRQDLLSAFSANRRAQIQAETEAQIAADLAAEEKKVEAARAAGQALGSASQALTGILVANSEEQRNAAISAALDAATSAIVAKAASGAAKAFEGAQDLPFPLGLVVGPIVAGVVGGAILALRSQIKLAQGGLVTGGIPGKDSVPAMLMPGERVISAPNAQDPFRQQSGPTIKITNHIGTMDTTSAGRVKLAKEVTRNQKRNARLGFSGAEVGTA